MSSKYEDPPAWFKLENYDATFNMSALDWQKNISTREGLEKLLERSQQTGAQPLDCTQNPCALFDERFFELTRQPIQHAKEPHLVTTNSAVFPLTIERARQLVDVINSESCNHVDNNSQKNSCDQKLAMQGEIGFSMHQHLVIDFRASKQEIMQAFNSWLDDATEKHRANYPRKKEPGITEKTLSDWHRDRVLPYQDLYLWHMRQGKTMPRGSALMYWLKPLGDSSRNKAYALEGAAKQIFNFDTIKQLSFPIGLQLNGSQHG